jgi:hypothetical protein
MRSSSLFHLRELHCVPALVFTAPYAAQLCSPIKPTPAHTHTHTHTHTHLLEMHLCAHFSPPRLQEPHCMPTPYNPTVPVLTPAHTPCWSTSTCAGGGRVLRTCSLLSLGRSHWRGCTWAHPLCGTLWLGLSSASLCTMQVCVCVYVCVCV